ncbi:MAG: right-handed parallel beta-helix repeat-containing protein [Salinivirgaceae bacterium]
MKKSYRMKKFQVLMYLVVGLVLNLNAQLTTGTYTVGGITPDYTNLVDAVSDLNTLGIAGDGPVVFSIAEGNYTGQLLIGEIANSSAVNTVTFESASGDSSKVTIMFATTGSTNNYVVQLNGCDYVSFKKLTFYNYATVSYTRVVELNGTATNNAFQNCRFVGFSGSSASNSQALLFSFDDVITDLLVENCFFQDGGYGIYLDGSGKVIENLNLTSNSINTVRGIYLSNADRCLLEQNTIIATNSEALTLRYCDFDIQIVGNTITLDYSGTAYGIWLGNNNGNLVEKGLIANNSIYVNGTSGYNAYGIYIDASVSHRIYHNSIHISNSKNTGAPIYAYSGSNIELLNNNLVNSVLGYALYATSSSTYSIADNNNYYTAGNFLAYLGEDIADLTALKAKGKDANSTDYYPSFVSNSDLRVLTPWLNGTATTSILATVPNDKDGNPRDGSNPDVGAFESTPTNTLAYSGTLTIGAGGDFATFNEAVDSLELLGVSAPVEINVADGNYVERVIINRIPGSGASNRITFQSASADSTKATLNYSTVDANDNGTIVLQGAGYLTFKQLKMINSSTLSYGRVVDMKGRTEQVNFENNTFIGAGASSGTSDRAVIFSSGYQANDLLVTKNVFTGGSRHIAIKGIDATVDVPVTNVNISANVFNVSERSILLEFCKDISLSGNQINDFTYNGISIYNCENPLIIEKNKINSTSSYYQSVRVESTVGPVGGIIKNNFISHNYNSSISGLYLRYNQYIDVSHNSVNVIANSGSTALYLDGNSNLNLKNNILANNGSGYAIYVYAAPTNLGSDHNNLYTTGNNLVYWTGTSYSLLGDYQTALSQDANSLSLNPNYTSATDLHINSYWLEGAGETLASVTDDIDGDVRQTPPCIGADEYISTLSPLVGTFEIGIGGDYETISEAVTSISENGISGNVVFEVLSGTYNEHFVIPEIFIVHPTDSVIIRSKTGVASDVIITYEATIADDNYLAKLEGTDRFTFENLTFTAGNSEYSRCISMYGNLNNITIKGCTFNGRSSASMSTNDIIIYAGENDPYFNQLLIENNTFNGGSWVADFKGSGSKKLEQLIIRDNQIVSNYRGIYISDAVAPVIDRNTITCNAENSYGIKLNACESGTSSPLKVINNKIYSNFKTSEGGIYLYNVDGTSTQPGVIANNAIQNSTSGAYNSYGIYTYSCEKLNVYYNSINITGNNTGDKAFYAQYCGDLNIYNNSFAIRGELGTKETGYGYAIDISSGTNIIGDYNNFYTPGNYIARWQGISYVNLSDLQTASGQFANSLAVFPAYQDVKNLNTLSPFLNASAQPYSGLSTDLNGVMRDVTNPDIGAYEILSPASALASGTYTVGTGGDMPTIDSMYRALFELGIAGPVTFAIKNGSYTGVNLFFKGIPGTSASDTVVIQSEAMDSSKVSLGFVQTTGNNYIFYLNGTKYLTIKNLTLYSGGVGYGSLLVMDGNVQHINLLNNRFNGLNTNSSNNELSSVYLPSDNIVDYLLIKNNLFNYNSYGINLNGYSNYQNEQIIIEENEFLNQYSQIYLYRINNPVVQYNILKQGQSKAINLYYCTNAVKIIGNQIATSATNIKGIELNSTDGSGVTPGVIANNFVQCNGTYGIYLDYSDYHNVYHNSVNHTGDNSGSAFYVYSGNNIKLKNNIFNTTSNGYAYYSYGSGSILESDYNNINAAGTRYAYYGATATNLTELKALSSMDANSFEVEPVFLTESDLHLISFDLMEKAVVLPEITMDIDKELRDAVKPDIGADEMYARPPVAESKVICEGEETPDLTASGINIKWYSDEALENLIWTSGTYSPNVTAPGEYIYYVTQTVGADESEPTQVSITINPTPDLSAVVVNIDCQGNNYGSINLTVSSENAPFFFRWSNESTTEDVSKLLAGNYTVTVSDILGCTSIQSYEVTAPTPIELTMIANDADCGDNNGSATVFAEGGNEPFTYMWTTGDTKTTIDSLVSGIYVVTVTDQDGCTKTGIATVNDLGGSVITVDAVNDVSCYGGNNGSIAVSLAGGVTPYNITWSNGATSEDINNLEAGPYEINVTDGDGCSSVKSIQVNQPDPILIGLGEFDANCGQANGSATTNVSGGMAPYSYSWSTGSTASEISSLGLGVYGVTVIDANTCQANKSFAISESGAPVVYVDSVIEGTCGNSDGAIYITAYGGSGTQLDYLWNTGSTSEDLVGVNPGAYSVTVTDSVGCSGATVAEIVAEKPETPSICIVTVDTTTNNNEIIWEKPFATDIDYYNIYRESTQSGVYQKIGERQYTEESLFVDVNSNAKQRSYRYKISAVNTCSVESELSELHKTMHLTINLGTNGNINLIWDHYEGFKINTYYIYRYTPESGWVKHDSIASNLTSYTDFDAPLENLQYMIEIVHPYGCTATKAVNRNTSRSNVGSITNTGGTGIAALFKVTSSGVAVEGAEVTIADVMQQTNADGETTFNNLTMDAVLDYSVTKTGFEDFFGSFTVNSTFRTIDVELTPVGIVDKMTNMIKLYPNPNHGSFNLSLKLDQARTIRYRVYDATSMLLVSEVFENQLGEVSHQIHLESAEKGFYIVQISIDQEVYYKRIIVN